MLRPRVRSNGLAKSALLFLLLCTGFMLSLFGTGHDLFAAAEPVRLAVIEFESAASDTTLAPLGKGLQSMLTTDLTGLPGVQVIERQQLKGVLAELDLGKSGLKTGKMDKATIAKIGKLAGASRLLGGSFTVLGGKMRLDGRLYAVETGEVLAAASIDGDKDAFFELEKQLAHKVVDALGVVLKPKERAVLAKVHTADFEAFQSFSRGLAAFDDKRYQDALTALGDATRRDKDFALAARTLDEYEKLIGELRGRAESMSQNAEAEADARGHREQAAQSAKWGPSIDALWKIAGKSGGGQPQLDRLAATFLLAAGYEGGFQLRFPKGDAFALDRTADELEKRYLAEAKTLFPRIPPFVALGTFNDPNKGESVEDWVHRTWKELERAMSPAHLERAREGISREISNIQNTSSEDALVNRLQLDERASLRLAEQLLDWGDALDPNHNFRGRFDSLMGVIYRNGLELERSTAAFVAQTKHKDEAYPAALKRIADEIEKNQRLVKLFTEAKNPYAKEVLLLGGLNLEQVVTKYLDTAVPTDEGLRYLAGERRLRGMVYVDETPVWAVRSEGGLLTGARSDQRRTSEVRYFPSVKDRSNNPHDDNVPEALVVTGARPRRDGVMRFKVSFTPTAEVWNENGRHVGDGSASPTGKRPRSLNEKSTKGSAAGAGVPRAQVGVAFGIQSATGRDPTSGWVLFLGASELELARFVLTKSKDETRINNVRTELLTTTISKRPYQGLTSPQSVVTLRFAGKTAEVTVDGHKTAIEIPAERDGFQGLFFKDLGYASVAHLALD